MLSVVKRSAICLLMLPIACSYPELSFGINTSDASDAAEATDTNKADVVMLDTSSETVPSDTKYDAIQHDAFDPHVPSCKPLPGGSLCDHVASFGTKVQIVDSYGDEFCTIPGTTFLVRDMARVLPPSPSQNAKVEVRMAWSKAAIHMHLHVIKENVVPADPMTTSQYYEGDGLEFFLSGTDKLTGAYNAMTDSGAKHFIITAPTDTQPSRGAYYVSGTNLFPIESSLFAARRVSDGYEMELRIPWLFLESSPASGSGIGFDLAVDLNDNPAVLKRQVQGVYAFRPVAATSSCAPNPIDAYCDDRVWCTPKLD
ncbi:MAG: hypothetical protein NVSMB1_08940 [Polyangiales bacterium]